MSIKCAALVICFIYIVFLMLAFCFFVGLNDDMLSDIIILMGEINFWRVVVKKKIKFFGEVLPCKCYVF